MSFMTDIPIGLGMALAENPGGMEKFSAMDHGKREQILKRAYNAKSRAEMQAIVRDIMGV